MKNFAIVFSILMLTSELGPLMSFGSASLPRGCTRQIQDAEHRLTKSKNIQLRYYVNVPANVPQIIEGFSEDGLPARIDGPTLYRFRFHGGWQEYLFFYQTDQVDVLTDTGRSMSFCQGPQIAGVSGWDDGFAQCRRDLRRLVSRYGQRRVKSAIALQFAAVQVQKQ